MFIQIEDPSEAPVPPEQVRFRALEINPYPDRGRVKLTFEVTPFQSAPDLGVEVFDQNGRTVATLIVIGANTNKFELTAHLRPKDSADRYELKANLSYEELGQVDLLEKSFSAAIIEDHDDG
jgi:hypothetical protein